MIKPLAIAIPSLLALGLGFFFTKPAKAKGKDEAAPSGGGNAASGGEPSYAEQYAEEGGQAEQATEPSGYEQAPDISPAPRPISAGGDPYSRPSPPAGGDDAGAWEPPPTDYIPPQQGGGVYYPPPSPTQPAAPATPAQAQAAATQIATQAAAAAPAVSQGLKQYAPGERTLKLTQPPMKGNDVLGLQVVLNGMGYKPRLLLDGTYGQGSMAAVRWYQKSRGLTADGVAGKTTWAALLAAIPSGRPAGQPKTPAAGSAAAQAAQAAATGLAQYPAGQRTIRLATPPMKGSDVLALQVMLNGTGANPPLKLDGVYGPAGARAVRVYQSSKKMIADGVVGKSTWASLMSAVPKTPVGILPGEMPVGPGGVPPIGAYCASRGGKLITKKVLGGKTAAGTPWYNDVSYCQLPGGREVEAWQFYREGQRVTPQTPSIPGLPTIAPGSRTLKSVKTPMRGTDVLALQVLLNEAGAAPQLKLDGSYGPSTLTAVKKYQLAHKLLADGQVGANTWSALRQTGGAIAPPPPKPIALPPGSAAGLPLVTAGSRTLKITKPPMKGTDVIAAQTLLNKSGVAQLALDGSYGPGTSAAVKKYQKQKGLVADGVLGASTWTSLRRYDTTSPAAPAPAPAPAPQAQKVPQGSTLPFVAGLPTFATGSRVIRSKTPYMRGTDVQEVQSLLNRAGYTPVLTLDGVYGPAGVKAVRWLQQSRSLTVDGVVGPNTLSVLRQGATPSMQAPAPQITQAAALARRPQTSGSAVVPASVPVAPAIPALPTIPGLGVHPVGSRTIRLSSPYMKGTDVLALQGLLNVAGASPPLTLDGVYGPSGVRALKAYQLKNRLTADGVAGPSTWAVLQGGSVGAILEDPHREAAQELTAHLKSIGGIGGVGREDKAIVMAYQRLEGIRADGLYSPGDAARILKHGLVPVAPFYWASDDTMRNKQRDIFLSQVLKGQQLNPPQAKLYDELREDTIKRLGEVSK